MTHTAPFSTRGPYRRNPAHDKRIVRGDGFTGNCWEEPSGVRFWQAAGVDPNGATYSFESCPWCAGNDDSDGRGRRYTLLNNRIVPAKPCPRCNGAGWISVSRRYMMADSGTSEDPDPEFREDSYWNPRNYWGGEATEDNDVDLLDRDDLEEPDDFDLAPLEMNLDEDSGMRECPHCNGSGELWFDLIDGVVSIDCSHCAGTGWVRLPDGRAV